MTSQEMMKSKHKPGYWFENIAPLGKKPDWREVVKPFNGDENGDPKLFGYDVNEFMAKQYK